LEGVFSNDPLDPGGRTKFGITDATWRRFGDGRDVAEISEADARGVYRAAYWDPLGCDGIDVYVAAELFDTAVNCGVGTAAFIAQNAYNFVRRPEWPRIAVDGNCGGQTRAALERCVKAGDRLALLVAMNGEQSEYYKRIIAKNERLQKFARGWTRRLGIAAKA
jgi:lysozyme family protein